MQMRTRFLVVMVAVLAPLIVTGPGTAAAEPVRAAEGYGFRLDPLTTKLFATDPARALADLAHSRSLSAPYGLEGQNFWLATELAQRAARHPQGCVEFHVRTSADRSTWSAVGRPLNPCPWVVPSMWREAPTPIGGWSRG
ncbi:hypothetical protein BH683_023575 [Williamsia sp. 1138]|uniref:SCP domain-containing protein n=1 Tax=Gordonia rubripertincta TaxID=36822 RepID=A0ABT4MYV9_GORRU|nr:MULTISPECIES: hypothetical protein [Mycobacteriales]MCZ4552177.1 hypothetical protein [Gordonia rubripertincta]OZG26358.1 hypothetical protein BH683_023575 [Williamsia sp. 1138]